MYFLTPFVNVFITGQEFEELAAIMDDEENVKYLIDRIDVLDLQFNAEEREKEKIKRKKFWKKIKGIFKKNNANDGG
jgi:hypothetical protein